MIFDITDDFIIFKLKNKKIKIVPPPTTMIDVLLDVVFMTKGTVLWKNDSLQ